MELKCKDVDDLCIGAAFWARVAAVIPISVD